jgi:FAD/FMN-containing dehydrogenase
MTTRVRTTHGTETDLDRTRVEDLRARLRGPLLQAGEAGYDAARAIWNGMIDRHPALIVRASGAADVRTTVRFAREHDLLLGIKGGGHNIAGTAVPDGGLMLDLSALKGIHVDLESRTVRVQPGCVWGDVDHETQPQGLAVPNGVISTTSVSGLTLGGGFGWTTRRFGYTSDNLIAADVITADGERLRASADENPDLFWGIRGGGGNFGVVTLFAFQAHSVGPEVVGGMILHPMKRAREVIDFFRDFTAHAPDELTCLLVLRKAPPAPALPKELHGRPVAIIAACYVGPVAEGERVLQPLKAFGQPLADLIGPKPFAAIQTMLDAGSPHGRQYYWKSDYFRGLPDEAVVPMIEHAEAITSPQSAVLFMHLGGAANRLPADHSAAGPRDIDYVLNIQGAWLEPAESETHTRWVRDYWRAMHPHSSGQAYMNFFTADEGADRLRAAYADATYQRLAALKARFDPDNFFRLNQNIQPAAAGRAPALVRASLVPT